MDSVHPPLTDTPTDGGVCAGCLNQLLDEDYVSALSQEWHMECFRCSACDIALSSWYFEKDGLLFCQADYWARYGEACQHCGQIITGPVMAAGDHRFHPECFCCELCAAFIGDGEAYALIERSKLYCGACYERVMRPLSRGGRRHAIQLVEVPPHASNNTLNSNAVPFLRLAPDPHRGLTIKHVDVSCGLMALHIGDRILEINGTPVKDQPISQIEHLICYSDTVLQLTIEHDPDDSNKPAQQTSPMPVKTNTADICESVEVKNVRPTPETPVQNVTVNSSPRESAVDKVNSVVDMIIPNGKVESKDQVTRERVFKKRNEDSGAISGMRTRQLWRKAGLMRTPHPSPLKNKERSSSMSRLIDGSPCEHTESCEGGGVFCDLARTRSFRVDARPPPTVFRAADLLQGELLGSGFFGQVFKVTHRDTNEVMVLKQLYRVDEDAQKNFLKEVAVLRSLSHPNVLRFVGVLYKEQRLHLVTEYISGGTLRALLEGPRAPPWAERAGYARDISAGLAYLHRMNIIHRDLNSHNCLVREDKTVIVADFGLARIVKRTGVSGSLERSQRGSARERKKRYTVVGNPYWMAPEMMKGNVYDEKVDVFSFGIVLCEIIGRVHADPDFLPRSSDFGLNQALFIDKFCEGCPETLYNIAFICCNLNPDKRPPFEVIEVWLEALSMHLSVQRPPPSDLLQDIVQYNGSPEITSPLPCYENTSELTLVPPKSYPPEIKCFKLEESITEDINSVLKKSRSGNILEAESKLKAASLPETVKLRGLGPKCISASHLCLPSKPVMPGTVLSKSQNALTSTPAGYILSTVNKKINITKVDDVREWLDNPIILREGLASKEVAEKRQSLSENEFNFQNKSRKVDSTNTSNVDLYNVNATESGFKDPNVALKSKSHANVDLKYAVDFPSYLRNQSVEELESDKRMMVDVLQPISRHFSIPDQYAADNLEFSSDSDDAADDVKVKISSPLTFKRIFKTDSNAYTVNADESVKSKLFDGGKRKMNVSSNIQQLRQNFEPKKVEPTPVEKSNCKSFNTFAKKLLSPKLGRKSNNPLAKIFQHNNHQDDGSKDLKNSRKGKSTFFVSKPHSIEINKAENVIPICSSYSIDKDAKSSKVKPSLKCKPPKVNIWPTDSNLSDHHELVSNPNKLSNGGKCITPLLRRHNRQIDDTLGSVGRFSYREKRLSPLKYMQPDKNDLKQITSKFTPKDENIPFDSDCKTSIVPKSEPSDIPTPLIRCNNFKNIPLLNSVASEGFKIAKPSNEDTTDGVQSKPVTNIQSQYTDSELGISTSNYVSLANLRINCPSLGRTRESLVRRNISKFDSKNKISTDKPSDKCVLDVEEASCLSVNECKKPSESTPL
ncbi:LIM domain kinase 1 isoform X2 [Arctopsyche grandis]|uniref:LIM domain kinase 1 isoform X2 n=1 Tax=Arctopsyche grandis TaxID=121162 RepID=UPI00406D8459